jgi:hypothetical protein
VGWVCPLLPPTSTQCSWNPALHPMSLTKSSETTKFLEWKEAERKKIKNQDDTLNDLAYSSIFLKS